MPKKSSRNDLKAPTNQLMELKTDLYSKLDRVNSQLMTLGLEYKKLLDDVDQIDAELAYRSRPTPEPRLSDHALMRFAERALGLNIEALKARIMTPVVIQAIKNGASAVTVEGIKMKVVDNTIVTVYQPRTGKIKNHAPKETDGIKAGLDDYYQDK